MDQVTSSDGTSIAYDRNGDAVADLVPGAVRQTLARQPHNVDPAALADAVTAFLSEARVR